MTSRRGLEFADGELVGMTSIDVGGDGRGVAGRLLLSPDGDRLALFTGELAGQQHDRGLTVPTLAYLDDDRGAFRVRYDGPLLLFPLLTPFLDLESGLARGELVDGAVALDFTPDGTMASATPEHDTFGTLAGTVVIGRTARAIRTIARATTRAFGVATSYPQLRLVLPSTPLGNLALTSTVSGHGQLVFALAETSSHPNAVTAHCTLDVALNGGAIALAVSHGDGLRAHIDGRIERVIPVRRPGRAGSVIETRYALCCFAGAPPGWLELSVELVPTTAPAPR
jgi:hypothetical protein